MKTKYLFSHRFKKIGWIILVPGVILGMYSLIVGYSEGGLMDFFNTRFFVFYNDYVFGKRTVFQVTEVNLFNAFVGTLIILGSLFVAFSRQKMEDEYISKIRLESLVWAIYLNYALLFVANIFVYGTPFFTIMTFTLFTPLFFFIIRFNWALFKLKKAEKNEE